MTELLAYIARSLVDQPDRVELKVGEAEGSKVYELKVAPEDIGKIIGRDGRTVNAVRTLLSAAALRKGEKARLEIVDDRRGPAAPVPASTTSGDAPA